MKYCLKLTTALTIVFICFSCDKTTIDIEDYQSEIVVDGWIEQDQFCKVILTLSSPYFSSIDSSNIGDYALTRAKVTISTESDHEILTLKPNNAYFPPYVYQSIRMKGKIGETYHLLVEYGGRKTRASTTIPEPVSLDKTWFELNENNDSLGLIYLKFTDDVQSKNYYRTLTKVVSQDKKYIANYFPNFNDELFNGKEVEAALMRGNNSNTNRKDSIYYSKGDTIMLKFCTLDKNSFDFWQSFHRESNSAGNPFASTNARVKSNISNGLGIWCGYGANYYQIIAQ